MGDRTLLGPADVPDTVLGAYAATALGHDRSDCEVVGSRVEVVDYDLDALTTAGRWWVTAEVSTPDGPGSVRFFVRSCRTGAARPTSPPSRPSCARWPDGRSRGGRRGVRSYAEGRLAHQVAPLLRADELWEHPVLATAFGASLRDRLLAELDRVGEHVDWLETVAEGAAHGDACTNNLLVQAGSDDLVLIDFGFWSTQPLGFDLGQLLLGDVQLGRRPASMLGELERACLPAYVEGLRDEGCDVPGAVVRRSHALQLLLYSGFSAFLIDGLVGPTGGGNRGGAGTDPRPGHRPTLQEQGAERARITEFVLDLVEQTEDR